MDDPGATTRVEIELTPNESSRAWKRRSDTPSTFEPAGTDYSHEAPTSMPDAELRPVGGGDQPPSVERRKLVVVGVGAAIVALLVGWALGRSGDSSSQSPADEAQSAPSTTEPSGLGTLPQAETPSTVPVTTRPVVRAGPTTTLPPEWEVTTVPLDAAVSALGIEIVAVGNGRILELDTATGEMRSLTTGHRYSQPPLINAGQGWALIRDLNDGSAELVRDGEQPIGTSVSDPWSTFFQHDTGYFWRVSSMFMPGQPTEVDEVDFEGRLTGRSLQLPSGAWVAGADPAGGVVAGAPGGTYSMGVDGARRLTTGNLIALSTGKIVATECGADFSDCGLYVTDRATGERTQAYVSSPALDNVTAFDLQSPAMWNSPDLLGSISPDGRWVPIMATTDQSRFGLLDLTTGEFVVLDSNPMYGLTGLWWSPDGRWVILEQKSRLVLFDTVDQLTIDILPQDVSVEAFAVRLAV